MKKTLSITQLKAAQLLAKGWAKADAARQASVNDSTIHRWLKGESFSEAVAFLQKEQLNQAAILAEATGGGDDLTQSHQDEIEIRELVKPIVSEVCATVSKLVRQINDSDIELPARMLPQLMSAASQSIQLLREGNDRITGLEALLDELGKIEDAISAKSLDIANGGAAEGS
ncbi:MAG: hypothetical protein AAGL17_04015 [Cyanobacteria bacterium J06576_12]